MLHRSAFACAALLLAPLAAQAALDRPGDPGDPPQRQLRALRGVMQKSLANQLPVAADQTQVVLKLVERTPGLVVAGALVAPDVLAVLGKHPHRAFFAERATELATIRARQWAATAPGEHPPVDLGLYFVVATPDAATAQQLVVALNALPTVELAYARERPAPPPGDIPPLTPDYTTTHQTYRAAAPTGIDADFARTVAGASGAGVTMVEIEWGWDFDHEDIARLRPSALIGPAVANPSYNDHGVAVIGELTADADAYGMTGLVPDLAVRVATNYPATGYSVANAIAVALPHLQAGDLLVLEAQTYTPFGLGPTEWVQADFDAILIATTLGVITVEAAGNGAVDLDGPGLGGLFNRAVRDSGAILVGASNGAALSRAPFSCFGNIVDANGWGYNVATTGYGMLSMVGGDPRQRYTNSFSGTSSATPMVAAAVAALRGAATAQLDPTSAATLDGFAIRNLLRSVGTALPNQRIGHRVDLRALLEAAGILRGLAVTGATDIGQTCAVELQPAPGFAAGDVYAIVASLGTQNVALPGVQGRWLLDAATSSTIGFGVFGPPPALANAPITVPNDVAFRGLRVFVQAISLQVTTGALGASHAGELFVRR